jgi:hypothetical protein
MKSHTRGFILAAAVLGAGGATGAVARRHLGAVPAAGAVPSGASPDGNGGESLP